MGLRPANGTFPSSAQCVREARIGAAYGAASEESRAGHTPSKLVCVAVALPLRVVPCCHGEGCAPEDCRSGVGAAITHSTDPVSFYTVPVVRRLPRHALELGRGPSAPPLAVPPAARATMPQHAPLHMHGTTAHPPAAKQVPGLRPTKQVHGGHCHRAQPARPAKHGKNGAASASTAAIKKGSCSASPKLPLLRR